MLKNFLKPLDKVVYCVVYYNHKEGKKEVNTMMYDYDREIRAERAREERQLKRYATLSANAWRFNDYGSAAPREASMDCIMAAYNDAYTTDNYYNYY